MPGDFQGNGTPQVLLDQRQGQVDASRDPRRGPHRAVVDENRVGFDPQLRMLLGQLFAAGPMGDHTPSVQPAAGGQQKRPGTHRRHPPRTQAVILDPGHQRRVLRRLIHTPAASNEQSVAVFNRQRLGQQRQSRRRHDRAATGSNHRRRVWQRQALLAGQVVGRGKHLQRPGDIQHLHVGEGQHMNGFRWCGHIGVIRGFIGVYARAYGSKVNPSTPRAIIHRRT